MTRWLLAPLALSLALLCYAGNSGSASTYGRSCPVTVANGRVPPEVRRFGGAEFTYGNADLRVRPWPHGTLIAGRFPDGGAMAIINRDGSISAKLAWWRGMSNKLVGRRLVVSGRRIDAPAPPLRASVPVGYGALGIQPTGLTFPTVGCWQVVGKQGRASLTFVVKVTKIGR
jgi:hypothetical protein